MKKYLIGILALMIGGLAVIASGKYLKLIESTKAPKDLLTSYVFSNKKKGHQSNALLIKHKGQVVYEQYARGFHKDSRLLAWSIAKSITGTLVGAAIQRGDLKMDDKIFDYLGPIGYAKFFEKDERKKNITIRHLMGWGSGLNWTESYEESKSFTDSSIVQLLYGTQITKDSIAYILSHELAYEPGARFYYSSGDSVLLSGVLRAVYQKSHLTYPWDLLFDKLDMKDTSFEADEKGTFVGSSFLYATTRDLAKIGDLYLNNGYYNGEQILPSGWVQFSSRNLIYLNPKTGQAGITRQAPGNQWWLNRQFFNFGGPVFPSAPIDILMGLGHHGQFLIIIPSLDIVAVRYGEDKEARIDTGELLRLIINYVNALQQQEA